MDFNEQIFKKSFIKNIDKSKMISISPLQMIVYTKQTIKSLAINEVSILRQSRQAANLSIKISQILL